MAQELFSVSTRHDTTFSLSEKISSIINQLSCNAFANRFEGGFTATVIVKNDGTTTKKEVLWDPGTDPKLEESLRFNSAALLDEMERVMLGNGDHNGTVVFIAKK